MVQSAVGSATATEWVKLEQDFSFIGEGAQEKNVLKDFKHQMDSLKGVIDKKNQTREFPYFAHPAHTACALSV